METKPKNRIREAIDTLLSYLAMTEADQCVEIPQQAVRRLISSLEEAEKCQRTVAREVLASAAHTEENATYRHKKMSDLLKGWL